jgi:hypothetical protein
MGRLETAAAPPVSTGSHDMRAAMLLTRTLVPLLCLAGVLSASAAAQSEKPAWQKIDADALVSGCWALSKEDRDSGVTQRMREGTARTLACLEAAIIRQGGEFFDPQVMGEAETRQVLDEISAPYGKLYWAMAAGHKGCIAGGCGTVQQVVPVLALARLFESVLRDLVAQRNRYEQ